MAYVGNKNFGGVLHEIINRIPKSSRYFSLFYGAGGIENSEYTSEAFFICAEKNPENIKYQKELCSSIEYNCYTDLIEDNVFKISDFIFSDPPYMFSTRTSGRKYYKYEFSDTDHFRFLSYIRDIKAKCMITHPECDLYDSELSKWIKHPIKYMTHSGIFNDCIWTNYELGSIELLNYSLLGENFTDRQRIKRQRAGIVKKFKNLPFHVRMAIIEEFKKESLI